MQKLETFSSHDVPRNAERNVQLMQNTSIFCAPITPDAYIGYVGFEKSMFGDSYPSIAK